ncbi:uncharacterized protein G2W53_010253 [Senna tora]|uniref:Uncharacterized protein n=1 Tax=Senna tora TaxID=362788 RepID=A0A835C9F3_9FABA|nr:uncharacterized protein G2W53_010253 [Senna tora]
MLPIRPLRFPNQQYRAFVVQRNQSSPSILFSIACVALYPLKPSRALLCWKFFISESGVSLSSTASRGRDRKPQPSVYFLLASPSRSHLILLLLIGDSGVGKSTLLLWFTLLLANLIQVLNYRVMISSVLVVRVDQFVPVINPIPAVNVK